MRSLILWPQARLDVGDAAGWYEAQKTGLGLRFLAEIDHVLSRIRFNPLQFPEIDPGVRRGLLRDSPIPCIFPLEQPVLK